MVTNRKRQLLHILLLSSLTVLLVGCVDAREVGQQAGVLFRQLVGLSQQFLFGFIEGCCTGSVAPSAVLLLLAFIVTRRRVQ